MAKIKVQCHVCSKVMKVKEEPAECVQCKASLTDKEAEVTKKFEYCNYTGEGRSGKYGGAGLLLLTDRRFLFIKNAKKDDIAFNPMFGFITILIDLFASKVSIVMSISPDEVQDFNIEKVSFIQVMAITTKDGKKYRFNINKNEYEAWKSVLLPN